MKLFVNRVQMCPHCTQTDAELIGDFLVQKSLRQQRQNLLLALHAQGYASCWISSTLFCQQESREALGMDDAWFALGTVAAGPMPAGAATPRPPLDLTALLRAE